MGVLITMDIRRINHKHKIQLALPLIESLSSWFGGSVATLIGIVIIGWGYLFTDVFTNFFGR